ncbi:hypothetical protein ACFFYR_04815, partial [Paraburkholderia dipogonis]|uniref:hypothetical protein n=1 Tax=Paraburkholderia dipogonis TaxID=1211383 RepID=UPI0035E4DE5D
REASTRWRRDQVRPSNAPVMLTEIGVCKERVRLRLYSLCFVELLPNMHARQDLHIIVVDCTSFTIFQKIERLLYGLYSSPGVVNTLAGIRHGPRRCSESRSLPTDFTAPQDSFAVGNRHGSFLKISY